MEDRPAAHGAAEEGAAEEGAAEEGAAEEGAAIGRAPCDVAAICARHGNRADALLEVLHDVQAELGHVPRDLLVPIAAALNLSRADVHGTISFYHDFRDHPPGRRILKVCRAEACQAVGAEALAAHAEQRLGLSFGETAADGAATLEAVYCLGNCALGPAVMLDGRLHGRVSAGRLDSLLADRP